MVPQTRRRLLSGCAATLSITIAACVGEYADPTDGSSEPGPDEEDVIVDVTTYTTRLEAGPSPGDSLLSYEEPADEDHQIGRELPYVINDDDAEALIVDPEPPDVEALRTFLGSTDYDEATVLAFDFDVSACHEWRVMYVEHRSGSGFAPQFCSTTRDPQLECSTDETHRQLTLIRVAEAVDRVPHGHGRGRSSSCRLPSGHPARADAPGADRDDDPPAGRGDGE